ncbi:MAG TPA: cobalt ECF transporter T component CbiQ [Candidatus Hydrogenedentes bacterium]|nr:cobalt ECF transporter T component CbiQ [Candidatus Hydrogenedentota bacterium]
MQIFEPIQPRSPITRRDPRMRVVAACAFAAVVCVTERPFVLASGFGMAVFVCTIARAPFVRTVRRLAALNLFMILLVVSLPLFAAGAPLVEIGPIAWTREGFWRAVIIAVRANTIMIGLSALLATMEPAHFGFALSRLGVPDKLTHVLLFMVRYIEVIHVEYHRLRHAMRLRGFRPRCNRHTCRSLGYLVGLLLVRSLDRADRIVEAMKCRGFRGRFYVLAPFKLNSRDAVFAAMAGIVIVVLAFGEWGGAFGSVELFRSGRPDIQQVTCYSTYLLGSSWNPDGSSCVWMYDWDAAAFDVLARRDVKLALLEGSWRGRLLWQEWPGNRSRDLPDYAYYTQARGEDEPISLNSVFPGRAWFSCVMSEDAAEDHYFPEGLVVGTNYLVADHSYTEDEEFRSDLVLLDLSVRTDLGSVPLTLEEAGTMRVAVKVEKDSGLLLIARSSWPDSSLYLCRTSPFSKLDQVIVPPIRGIAQLTPPGEYVLELSSWDSMNSFIQVRVADVGGTTTSLEFGTPIAVPEPARFIERYSLDNLPRIRTTEPNIMQNYWRNGLMLWNTQRPARVNIAKENKQAAARLGVEDRTDFWVNDDGTALVTKDKPDSFRVYRVDFPKITFIEEIRLVYDRETGELSVERFLGENKEVAIEQGFDPTIGR